jgi:hypothetical protein
MFLSCRKGKTAVSGCKERAEPATPNDTQIPQALAACVSWLIQGNY